MSRRYKNELNNVYRQYTVIGYTPMRTTYNGCVIWKIKCKCGHIEYMDGNYLRRKLFGPCPKCGRRD